VFYCGYVVRLEKILDVEIVDDAFWSEFSAGEKERE
jgi:hypothetical protein